MASDAAKSALPIRETFAGQGAFIFAAIGSAVLTAVARRSGQTRPTSGGISVET